MDIKPVHLSLSDFVFHLSVALRKIDIIHLPSVDKPSQPPELLNQPSSSSSSQPDPQKSPPFIDASPKPPLTPVDSTQRDPLTDKLQQFDLPPKPHQSDLPPKPLFKDLPPKPQITDLPPKPPLSNRPGPAPAAVEIQGSKMVMAVAEGPSVLQEELSPQLAAEDVTDKSPLEMPIPLPRKINSVRVLQIRTRFHRKRKNADCLFGFLLSVLQVKNKIRRVKTIYDCQADNDDELTFDEGEVIIVTGEEDQEWWVGNTTLHRELHNS